MEQTISTITFHVEPKQKEKIREVAKRSGLGMASYCRHIIITKIVEEESSKNDRAR